VLIYGSFFNESLNFVYDDSPVKEDSICHHQQTGYNYDSIHITNITIFAVQTDSPLKYSPTGRALGVNKVKESVGVGFSFPLF
jgi:hypothetical protein